jgi:prepilin-type N-terminal cleavage/methylation domain-containing protein
MVRLRTLLRRLRGESGITLTELLVAMSLLGIVMSAVIALYISGVRAQTNITSTFNAETMLHVGLDRIRTDVHLACSETAQSATSVTLSLEPCDGNTLVTWCTSGSGSDYGLYRIPAAASTCTGGQKLADYLTSGSVFTYYGPNTPTDSYALARLHLAITVNATPTKPDLDYTVADDVAFANSARS